MSYRVAGVSKDRQRERGMLRRTIEKQSWMTPRIATVGCVILGTIELKSAAAPMICALTTPAVSDVPCTTSNTARRTTVLIAVRGSSAAGFCINLAVLLRARPYFCRASKSNSLSPVRFDRPHRPTAAITSMKAGVDIQWASCSSVGALGSWG